MMYNERILMKKDEYVVITCECCEKSFVLLRVWNNEIGMDVLMPQVDDGEIYCPYCGIFTSFNPIEENEGCYACDCDDCEACIDEGWEDEDEEEPEEPVATWENTTSRQPCEHVWSFDSYPSTKTYSWTCLRCGTVWLDIPSWNSTAGNCHNYNEKCVME